MVQSGVQQQQCEVLAGFATLTLLFMGINGTATVTLVAQVTQAEEHSATNSIHVHVKYCQCNYCAFHTHPSKRAYQQNIGTCTCLM